MSKYFYRKTKDGKYEVVDRNNMYSVYCTCVAEFQASTIVTALDAWHRACSPSTYRSGNYIGG